MLVLSVYYFRPRTYVLDAAFQGFSIVAYQDWAIQVKRYGAVMVQALPLLLARLGLPLDTVMLAYSGSFTLYPIVLFGVLCWLKAYDFAKIMALYFLLLMAHTFFWVQSEQIQATALTILALGVYTSPRLRPVWLRHALVALLILLVLYTYPLSVVALLYGFTYVALHRRRGPGTPWWQSGYGLLPVVLVLFVIKQFAIGTGGYDNSAMDLFKAVPNNLPDIFKLPTTSAFGRQLLTTYHLVLPVFLGVIVTLFRSRQRWKAAAVTLGCLGWLAIILPTFSWAPVQFYIESYYLLLGYLLAFPLVLDVFSRLRPRWVEAALVGLVVYRVVMIVHVSGWFIDRYDYLEDMTQKTMALPDQRYFIHEGDLWKDRLEQFWSLPFEVAMVSAAKDPARVRTIFAYGGDAVPDHFYASQQSAFSTVWGPYPYDPLDKRYFPLSDTTEVQVLPDAGRPE